jgi:hypothetical protein
MALYSVETKKDPEEVVERAIDYFGEEGLGLSVTRENPCCATFEGGGGHVTVTASRGDDKVEVEVETREWDYHVKRFIGRI